MNERLYVLAANYDAARNFAHQRGYHFSRMVIVDSREKLMGLRGIKLHVVDGAETCKNYGELMQEAIIRRLEIAFVRHDAC